MPKLRLQGLAESIEGADIDQEMKRFWKTYFSSGLTNTLHAKGQPNNKLYKLQQAEERSMVTYEMPMKDNLMKLA